MWVDSDESLLLPADKLKATRIPFFIYYTRLQIYYIESLGEKAVKFHKKTSFRYWVLISLVENKVI
jgi:hypothetical protein